MPLTITDISRLLGFPYLRQSHLIGDRRSCFIEQRPAPALGLKFGNVGVAYLYIDDLSWDGCRR